MIPYTFKGISVLLIFLGVIGCQPKMLTQVNSISEKSSIFDIVVEDNWLFLATRSKEIRVFDITDPSQPNQIATYSFQENPHKIIILDNLAYVMLRGSAELHILDISDISAPVTIGTYESHSSAYFLDMVIDEPYVYIANHRDGLRIIDISDVQNPQEINRVNLPHGARVNGKSQIWNLFLISDYLYVSGIEHTTFQGTSAAWVYDINNPVQPQLVSNEPFLPKRFFDASLLEDDKVIFAAGGYLYTVDVSDPKHPNLLGEYTDLPVGYFQSVGYFQDVVYIDGYIFTTNTLTVRVMDISDPKNLVEVESHDFSQVQRIEISGNHIFVDGGSGVQVFEFTPNK